MTAAKRHRPERVAALVQETLADALTGLVKDPRVGFVTVTGVNMSPDCGHATVRISVLGDEDEKARAMAGLESAKRFLRAHLAKTVEMRTVPELHFHLDRGLDHAARIDALLSRLRNEEPS